MSNQFMEKAKKKGTWTEKGAVSNISTGSALADQFGKAGSYIGRDINEVMNDQSQLHNSVGAETALRFIFYLRLVSRKVKTLGQTTDNVQKGQGQRDESFKRFLYYAIHHPELFYSNIWMFIPTGRYQDIFDILFYAHQNSINVQEARVLGIVLDYAVQDENSDLFLKYMPLPRAASKLNTDRAKFMDSIARKLRSLMGMDDEQMREFKTSGNAHTWQQKISQQKFGQIEFNKIPGRALSKMVNSDFLTNHDLQNKYVEWIKSQPTAKFTGWPAELVVPVREKRSGLPIHQRITLNRQFDGLIELAKEDGPAIEGNVLVAIDTSGSMTMTSSELTKGVFAMDAALGLGIYFAELNEGKFHNTAVAFDETSTLLEFSGTFSEKVNQILNSGVAWGTTNFQSVIDLMVRVHNQNPNLPLEEFPQTLIVVSDMQFDPAKSSRHGQSTYNPFDPDLPEDPANMTNHQMAVHKLRQVFPKEWTDDFKVVWWHCTNRSTPDFPSSIDDGGTYVVSGYDGAIVSMLTGAKVKDEVTGEMRSKTMEETIEDALSQEILDFVDVSD